MYEIHPPPSNSAAVINLFTRAHRATDYAAPNNSIESEDLPDHIAGDVGSPAFEWYSNQPELKAWAEAHHVTAEAILAHAFPELAAHWGFEEDPQWRPYMDSLWDAEEGLKLQPYRKTKSILDLIYKMDTDFCRSYVANILAPDDMERRSDLSRQSEELKEFYRSVLHIPEHCANELLRDLRATIEQALVQYGVSSPHR